MRNKLSESEILAAINAKATSSYGSNSQLENDRAQALDYYLGRPYGDEVDGRSDVVTRDVLETVEWILPSLMKIFTGGEKVVQFDPVGMEDEAAAKQETDVLNHVILNQNEAFIVFMTWFKDAMLSKNAYIKVYWDEKQDITEETYENLTEQEMAFISADDSVEIVQVWPAQFGFGVKLKRTSKNGKVCIDPVPPEEMRVSSRVKSSSLRDADYIEHRTEKTISEIRQMGLEIDDKIASDEEDDEGVLSTARDQYYDIDDDQGSDPSMREVLFRDVTIRIDADGDGIAELKRYYIVGDTILATYDAENVYYACIGPIPMPHKHIGLSIADLVMDIQRLRSLLMRSYIDNLFLQNNGRYAISERVNLDDMLVNRPGGVVRVDGEPGGAIFPLTHPSNGQAAIQGLEYLDTHKENRTGVTKYNQGLDAGSLNKTATGISQIMGASQQRLELIARIFAETGVKDAFLLVHELMSKHSTKPLSIKLNNEYVSVDPRQWKKRTDMTVSVGLGTGDKQQQSMHIMNIMAVQKEGLQIGITTPEQIYKSAKRLVENAGFKDGNEFFTDPSQQPPQQPQIPPELMQLKQDMENEIQSLTQQLQESQMKIAETEKQNMQREIEKTASQKMTEINNKSTKVQVDELALDYEKQLFELSKNLDTAKLVEGNKQADMTRQATDQNIQVMQGTITDIFNQLSQQIANSQPVAIRQIRDENGKLIGGVRVMADGTETNISF